MADADASSLHRKCGRTEFNYTVTPAFRVGALGPQSRGDEAAYRSTCPPSNSTTTTVAAAS